MRQPAMIVLMLLMAQILYAKRKPPPPALYASVDFRARQMPDSMTYSSESIAKYVCANFQTNTDRIRAIFIWMASNIDYDVENMYAINFNETKEDIIAKPLQRRKGICVNYAMLFNDICTRAGIRSYVVLGYTKQNGFAAYIPHAWCSALIDSAWYMFDPTWGSGYCSEGRFYRKINEDYFKCPPSLFISSHMPFDPLWEFLNYRVTNQEFYDGSVQQNFGKQYFHYIDSIAVYEREDSLAQLYGSEARITANGLKNSMIFQWLTHVKVEIENIKIMRENEKAKKENERQNKMVEIYNQSANTFSDGVLLFNLFIDYRNKQFTPLKPDAQIQAMIDTAMQSMVSARAILAGVKDPPPAIVPMAAKLGTAIDSAISNVEDQRKWLKDYFSRSKARRRYAFYTNLNVAGAR